MKKYQSFLPEKFRFLEVKFSIYLNRHVFVMITKRSCLSACFGTFLSLNTCNLILVENKQKKKRSLPGLILSKLAH